MLADLLAAARATLDRATVATSIPVPSANGDYRMVRIRMRSDAEAGWSKASEVYLRGATGPTVVGIDREI